MVFFLTIDVLLNTRKFLSGYRKCTVAALPLEPLRWRDLCIMR